jgi:hypothetical protein
MYQATSKAEWVVAVLSAAYLESGHGRQIGGAVYAKDPGGNADCYCRCASARC